MQNPENRSKIIETLKQELEILEKGGYAPSTEAPHWMPRVFRDSVSCPNLGLDLKIEQCSHCLAQMLLVRHLRAAAREVPRASGCRVTYHVLGRHSLGAGARLFGEPRPNLPSNLGPGWA